MKKTLGSIYGNILRDLRIERELTQEEVKLDSNLDVSHLETGNRLPRLDTLHCLCWYYGISVKDLVTKVEQMIEDDSTL